MNFAKHYDDAGSCFTVDVIVWLHKNKSLSCDLSHKMEAVPRMPMIYFELKQKCRAVEFGPILKTVHNGVFLLLVM